MLALDSIRYVELNNNLLTLYDSSSCLDNSTVPTITSIEFASHLGINHSSLVKTIGRYKELLESFSPLIYVDSVNTRGYSGQWTPKVKPNHYCLNEEQCYFLATLSRNTPDTIKFKKWLVDTFSALKRQSLDNPLYTFEPTVRDISGFIYLVNVKDSDIYKIGFSKNVIKRLSTLQSANAWELTIIERVFSISARKLEHRLHLYYQSNHIRGEWFTLSPEEVKQFIYIVNKLDKEQEQLEELSFLEEGLN